MRLAVRVCAGAGEQPSELCLELRLQAPSGAPGPGRAAATAGGVRAVRHGRVECCCVAGLRGRLCVCVGCVCGCDVVEGMGKVRCCVCVPYYQHDWRSHTAQHKAHAYKAYIHVRSCVQAWPSHLVGRLGGLPPCRPYVRMALHPTTTPPPPASTLSPPTHPTNHPPYARTSRRLPRLASPGCFSRAEVHRALPDSAPAPVPPPDAQQAEAHALQAADQLVSAVGVRGLQPAWERPQPAVLTPFLSELKWINPDLHAQVRARRCAGWAWQAGRRRRPQQATAGLPSVVPRPAPHHTTPHHLDLSLIAAGALWSTSPRPPPRLASSACALGLLPAPDGSTHRPPIGLPRPVPSIPGPSPPPLQLLWDSGLGEDDAARLGAVRDLVTRALKGPLLPAQQQQVLSELEAEPR